MRISDWSSDVCSSDLNLSSRIVGRKDGPFERAAIGNPNQRGHAVLAFDQLNPTPFGVADHAGTGGIERAVAHRIRAAQREPTAVLFKVGTALGRILDAFIDGAAAGRERDRTSTRLNSSH